MEQVVIVERRNKTILRDGDKLVKLFDSGYSKSNILNEALNQTRVAETGLNVPQIHEITLVGGRSAIVMDYIEGETLEQLYREYPERREEFLDLFIRVQQTIHAKKHLLLTKFADKLKMKIMQSELSASTRYDLSLRVDAMPRHTHICHGDYNPSNVVIDRRGVPYIIDWSHATQGNATADGVETYFIQRARGEDEFAQAYMEAYCRALGITQDYFRAWMPLVAAARLVDAETPEQRQMLMKWIEESDV